MRPQTSPDFGRAGAPEIGEASAPEKHVRLQKDQR
jgi:hypothetical protein